MKHNQDGAVSGLAISLILAIVLLITAAGFAVWAYGSRQDYKNNVDSKIDTAVTNAVSKEDKLKDAQFAEAAKQPLRAYQGPEAYGSPLVNYPKTWSAYVDDSGKSGTLVDGYFAPNTVPSINSESSVFALRIQVVNQAYAQTLQTLADRQKTGKLAVSAYALPKVPKAVGVKASGQISDRSAQTTGTMVILPLRSQTLKIWTEGNQYLNDFNDNILPNFSFLP